MKTKPTINVLRSIRPDTRPLLSKTVQSDTSDMLLGRPNPRELPISNLIGLTIHLIVDKLIIEAKKVPLNKPRRNVENIPKIIDVNNNFLRLIFLPIKLIVIDQKIIAPKNRVFPI